MPPPSIFAPLPQEPVPGYSRKSDLFDTYLGKDIRPLLQDAESRPAHYTEAQHDTIRRLRTGEQTTTQERSAILLQMTRGTEAQKTEATTRRRITREAMAPMRPPPSFENQDEFKGTIKLI